MRTPARLFLTAVLALAGAAHARRVDAQSLDARGVDAAEGAAVSGVCRNVMGLSPPFAQFEACRDALSASAVQAGQASRLATARKACLMEGAAAGPQLAGCELERSRAAPAGRVQLASADPDPRSGARVKPYWAVNAAEVRRREETACARLGLEPVGGAWAQCVGDLDAALFAADNSAH